MKKLLALLLAVIMVLGLVACVQEQKPTDPPKTTAGNNDKPTDGTTTGSTDDGAYFPLKEKKTLTIAVQNTTGFDNLAKGLEANVLWQDLLEQTNVEIKWVGWTKDTLQAMFANNEMGDIVLCGGSGMDNSFNDLAGQGVIAVLNDYVDDPEIVPNITATMWAECPEARGTFTAADGNLYVMGTYNMDRNAFVEGYLWVYKPWLDKAGLNPPTNREELETIMEYFATHDMNENGKDDEIPLWFAQQCNNGIESWLGMYGLPTKDGTFENYVVLEGDTDQVAFIPQMDEWKDFIKLFNEWWDAGYLPEEMFTMDYNTSYTHYNKNYTSTVEVGIMYTSASGVSSYYVDKGGQYVCFEPFPLGDADVRWYIHPGYMGSKTSWCVPEASENKELAVRFMDLLYNAENSVRYQYGEPDSVWRETFEDGTFYANTVSNDLAEKVMFTEKNSLKYLVSHFPSSSGNYLYEMRQFTTEEQNVRANYYTYEKYLNKNVWPRPYTLAEDQTRLGELRTDIFNLVNEKRAEWITGRADIDAEWEDFQQDLLDAGIEEFIDIMQSAYDVWYEGYSKFMD